MAIRFYLDNRPNKVGEHPIRVSVCVKGTKLISTIGHSVTPEVWADDTVIKPKYTNSKGTSGKQINADIMRLKAHFSEYEINLTDRPAKMELQLLLTACLKRDSAINLSGKTTVLFKHLDRFISEESLAGQWAYSTIRCWNTFRGHLAKFNPFITYDCFDEDGINQFLAFLRYEQKLTEKTVKKIYTHLKWFLGWAIRKRLCKETTINIYRPKFKVLEKPVIFLTKEELLKLYHFPIPPRGTVVNLRDFEGRRYTKTVKCREALIKTRDLFCFCAFTSLRYSDMAKVRRTDINGNYLYVTTQKTNDRIPIDLNAFAKEIIQKYKNRHFPEGLALPVISNQRMNRHLKELCELCGFNEPISRVYFRSGQRICETHAKWELIGTHAGRRTFICFALSSGIPPQVVMKWTGHSDYKTMRPYIDIAGKTKAEAMKLFERELKK